jgi:hypothetical protein
MIARLLLVKELANMIPQMCNFCHKLNAMCIGMLDKHTLYREFTGSLRWPKNCSPNM